MNSFPQKWLVTLLPISIMVGCGGNNSKPSRELIDQLDLKSGELISCGPADKEFGTVDFEMTCSNQVKNDFNVAVELLHSFEYDESEKVFTKIINAAPECAMAYWGIAMCKFHPLWEPPTEVDLKKGSKAISIANSITQKSERESAYINAIGQYYKDWDKLNARVRSVNFENAMEQLHQQYPADKEAAIFYALSLDAAADPTDKSYTNQKKAGAILNALYTAEPNHPGIIHYIIHTYDNPGIATFALPAARRYAAVAPSSAHALHMPSHIFTRLGLWDESIKSNIQSVEAAKCYAQSAGIKALWDEEMHGIDYLVYAYLQKGDNKAAQQQMNYIFTISEVYPVNFKGAYCFAAVPSRIALENKNWHEAASLELRPVNFPWNKFPWQEAMLHFARLLGAANTGDIESAQSEVATLNQLHDTLERQKDIYKSKQVAIQIKAGNAWIDFATGKKIEALKLMKTAADMEDSVSKHPVTPGEILPARELYADMLLQMKQYENALTAYEEVLQKSPNRFNSLYGAAVAAEASGNSEKARIYFKQLAAVASSPGSDRPELNAAKIFLHNH
jgi:tetratricopeptide (TPR) repeat protein